MMILKDQVVPYKKYIKDMVEALTVRENNNWNEYETALMTFKTNDPYKKKSHVLEFIIWLVFLGGAGAIAFIKLWVI